MTTSQLTQLTRLADLAENFKRASLAVPCDVQIHGAAWVLKAVILGTHTVVAHPQGDPKDRQIISFRDVFLGPDTEWRSRGGQRTETGWSAQNNQSAEAKKRRERVGPVDHLDLGLCGCEGLSAPEVCEQLAPLGLVAHPGNPSKTLHCRRFKAELAERRAREAESPKVKSALSPRPSRAVMVPETGRSCTKCGRRDGEKIGNSHAAVRVGEDGICSLHKGGDKLRAPVDQPRRCPKCREVKEPDEYSPGQSYCRPCKQAYDNERTAAAKKPPPAAGPCEKCGFRTDRRDAEGRLECHRHNPSSAARARMSEGGKVARVAKKSAASAGQDKAVATSPPAASSAPETESAGILAGPRAEALTAPVQPAVAGPLLGAQASIRFKNLKPARSETPAPAGGLLDQIDRLIAERRQLRTENAELRARLAAVEDTERQLQAIAERVGRELANV